MNGIRLTGPKALLALAVILAAGGAKMLLPATQMESRAREPILTWLRSDMGGELGRALRAETPGSVTMEKARELADEAESMQTLEIVELSGRRVGKERMLVRVRYRTTPTAAPRTRYLEMRTRAIGDWEVRRESGAARWYLSALRAF